MKSTSLILFSCAFSLVACEKSDLGDKCDLPGAAAAPTGDVGETNSEEVVFPATERKDARCESFSCISTAARANYCSKKCSTDRNCPDGFVCQQLQPVGPLVDEKFCILGKSCEKSVTNSCPQPEFQCNQIETSDAENPLFLCDQKTPGDKNAQ